MAKYSNRAKPLDSENRFYHAPSQGDNSGGFLQRVKGFFTQKQTAPASVKLKQSSVISELKQSEQNNEVVDISNISVNSKNPNDTLAEFFLHKGDKPLNDIEIEGVMSLIRKAHHSDSRNTSVINNQSRSGIFGPGNTSRVASGISRNHSLLFNDSNNSTILRQASANLTKPVNIATPTYIGNISTNNSSIENLTGPDITPFIRKRKMTNYSSLANNNNKRLVSPLASFIAKRKRESLALAAVKEEETNKVAENSDNNTTKRAKLSKTATKVLDILSTSKADDSEMPPLKSIADIRKNLIEKKLERKNDIITVSGKEPEIENALTKGTETSKFELQTEKTEDKSGSTVKVNNSKLEQKINTTKAVESDSSLDEKTNTKIIEQSNEVDDQKTRKSKPLFSFTPQISRKRTENEKSEPRIVEKTPLFTPADTKKESLKESQPAFTFKINSNPSGKINIGTSSIDAADGKIESKNGVQSSSKPVSPFNDTTKKAEQPASKTQEFVSKPLKNEAEDSSTVSNKPFKETEILADNSDTMIIDHFDFPDVSDSNIQLQQNLKDLESESFIFPVVQLPDHKITDNIDEKIVELYNDVFAF